MAHVTVVAAALAVGRPERDTTGRLQGWAGSPFWTVGFVDPADGDRAASWERLALAVGTSAYRFMNIDEDGNHVPDEELGTGAWTPSYVSDPYLTPRGVSVSADTGGFVTVAMVEAMIRVLVVELRHLPFDTEVSGYDPEPALVRWRTPYLSLGERTVIARGVRCVVEDRIPDVITEYLDAEGGWTTSWADARAFERDERGTHHRAWELASRLGRSVYEQG